MYFEYYLPHPFRQNVYCLMLNYYQINVTSQLYQWKCDSQQAIVIYNNICKNKYFTQSPKNNYSSFQLNSEIDSLPIASSDLSPINHFSLHLIKSTRILCIYMQSTSRSSSCVDSSHYIFIKWSLGGQKMAHWLPSLALWPRQKCSHNRENIHIITHSALRSGPHNGHITDSPTTPTSNYCIFV